MKRITSAIVVILLALAIVMPAFAAEYTVIITAPETVDGYFSTSLGVDGVIDFVYGVQLDVLYPGSLEIAGATAEEFQVFQSENRIILLSQTPVTISRDFVDIAFRAEGEPGETATISLSDVIVSVGTDDPLRDIDFIGADVTFSDCIIYSYAHTGKTGDQEGIPGTNCYCDDSFLLTAPDMVSDIDWTCTLSSENDMFGQNSEVCNQDSGEEIFNTGYCCEVGYMLSPEINNYNDLLGNRASVCVEIGNLAPIANIYSPENQDDIEAGAKIIFSSQGSYDSDGNITAYIWDFGDRSEPWGILSFDEDLECVATESSKSCAEDYIFLGRIDYDELGNPCVCEDYEEYIYPESMSNAKTVSYIYNSSTVCTGYDADETNQCAVSLTVTDNQNKTSTTEIILNLVDDEEDEEYISVCGDNITDVFEECDGTDIEACISGECNDDCTCYTTPSEPITFDSDPICGDGSCTSGETALNCIADCHCGDNSCQKELGENTDNCSFDCKESNFLTWAIILIILVIGGLIYGFWKGIISFGATPSKHEGPFDFTPALDHHTKVHRVQNPHDSVFKLKSYIQSTRSLGYSYSQIKAALRKRGWKEPDINRAF